MNIIAQTESRRQVGAFNEWVIVSIINNNISIYIVTDRHFLIDSDIKIISFSIKSVTWRTFLR